MLPKNSHEVLKLTDYEFGITPISIQFPEQCLGTILIQLEKGMQLIKSFPEHMLKLKKKQIFHFPAQDSALVKILSHKNTKFSWGIYEIKQTKKSFFDGINFSLLEECEAAFAEYLKRQAELMELMESHWSEKQFKVKLRDFKLRYQRLVIFRKGISEQKNIIITYRIEVTGLLASNLNIEKGLSLLDKTEPRQRKLGRSKTHFRLINSPSRQSLNGLKQQSSNPQPLVLFFNTSLPASLSNPSEETPKSIRSLQAQSNTSSQSTQHSGTKSSILLAEHQDQLKKNLALSEIAEISNDSSSVMTVFVRPEAEKELQNIQQSNFEDQRNSGHFLSLANKKKLEPHFQEENFGSRSHCFAKKKEKENEFDSKDVQPVIIESTPIIQSTKHIPPKYKNEVKVEQKQKTKKPNLVWFIIIGIVLFAIFGLVLKTKIKSKSIKRGNKPSSKQRKSRFED